MLFLCEQKVLLLQGNALQFLSGLSSNVPNAPQNAFLTIHGRIVATFEQVKVNDNQFLIAVHPQAVAPLLEHLRRYLILNKTSLELTDQKVYFNTDAQAALGSDEYGIPFKGGTLLFTRNNYPITSSDEEFTRLRLEKEWPLHMVDYHDEMILNVHEHDFVSYTKGCFLGQEPVAKVHHRSKPTWKLSVCFEDQIPPEQQAKMTSKIKDPVTGRIKGFCFCAT